MSALFLRSSPFSSSSLLLSFSRFASSQSPSTPSYLVVGVGNPHPSYDFTRHNIAADATHSLPSLLSFFPPPSSFSRKNLPDFSVYEEGWEKMVKEGWEEGKEEGFVYDGVCKSFVFEWSFPKGKILFSRPQSYMNLSGIGLKHMMNVNKIKDKQLIVMHDDVDLPLGTIRLKKEIYTGTHNGALHIQQTIGEKNPFLRVKIGVGRPKNNPPGAGVKDFVLKQFSEREMEEIRKKVFPLCSATLHLIFSAGWEKAQHFLRKQDKLEEKRRKEAKQE